LGARTVNIYEAREQLDLIAHAIRAVRVFFNQHPMNFQTLIDAVNQLVGRTNAHQYYARSRGITDAVTDQKIELPAEYPVLDTDPLRRLFALKSS
jgi:hypothetical protein